MTGPGRRQTGIWRAVGAAALTVAAVLATVGCAPETGMAPVATPATHAAGPTEAFVDRAELPSCGEVSLDQGGAVPDSAWECLDDAGADGAELAVTQPTTEGDGIVTYYRVGPGIDGLELFVDTTADRFAGTGAGWRHELCPGTTEVRAPRGCHEVG